MPFKVGENVGPYRVMEQLGQGGMATVFKAYHASLDRYVALKVLHPAFMQDPNFLGRFQREARVVAKLEHPNIVPVYDFAEHEGQSYLVMKYVEGPTLKARLQNGPVNRDEGLRIVEAVGAALSYAHAQDILHRDIKPSNVILSGDGRIYLTDFGLARIASAGESTYSSDMMVGTPQYISPEQAVGESDLDAGTDIYSFGVILYQLVVGRVPFSADTPFSVVHDHIYTPLPMPRAVNPNVPSSVERVLLKALSKERKARFKDVSAMVSAFKAAVAGGDLPETWGVEPSETIVFSDDKFDSASEAVSQQKPKKRRRWLLIPLAIALCLFSLFVLSRLDQRRGLQQDSSSTTQTAGNAALQLALQNAEANPEDPFAQLELASAYMDMGMEDEAGQALEAGMQMANEEVAFFIAAGDLLAAHGLWLPALETYLVALDLAERPQQSPELIQKIQQALYFAAEDPASESFFSVSARDEAGLPPPVLDVLAVSRARFQLFHGDAGQAARLIENVLANRPDFLEARLVRAEILLVQEQPEEAADILRELARNPGALPWIGDQARSLLEEL
jgi:serine/threonine protein kinase